MIKLSELQSRLPKGFVQTLYVSLILIVFQAIYVALRLPFLTNEIPLWYSKPWGDLQIAPKNWLMIIPTITVFVSTVSLTLSYFSKKYYVRYGSTIWQTIPILCGGFLTYSMLRIIKNSSIPFPPLLNPTYLELIVPGLAALIMAYLITPRFINFMKDRGVVTDPSVHLHPAMVLRLPSVRGGGFIFATIFCVTVMLFTNVTLEVFTIAAVALLAAVLGLLDDIQNTQPLSKLKIIENPYVRLGSQLVLACLVLAGGIRIDFISNPFDGILLLNDKLINIHGLVLAPISILITIVWIVWLINLLSWSNGIDGQYGGLVGVLGIVLALLALRSTNAGDQINLAKIGIIMAGTSFGILRYMWHPSKIMWGFGATSAGIIIATLAILTQTKVPAAILAILIPFLDAAITVIRRLFQKKSPLKGDRGHLHHLLLERGWSIKSIALFYWCSTALLGIIAIVSSDKNLPLIILTLSGIIAFPIILLNLQSTNNK